MCANWNSEHLILQCSFFKLDFVARSVMVLWGSTLLEINNGSHQFVPIDVLKNVPVLQLALGVEVIGLTRNGNNCDTAEPSKNITY